MLKLVKQSNIFVFKSIKTVKNLPIAASVMLHTDDAVNETSAVDVVLFIILCVLFF